MGLFRSLGRILSRNGRALAWVTVASCSNASNLKQLNLKQDPSTFSHKYLLQQAASGVTSSTCQLLTQSVVAIVDTAEKYKAEVLELLQLLEDRERFPEGDVADELSELITGTRLKADDLKSQLLELQSFMTYVEKLVISAAETAFLVGAEYCCATLSEQLHSAQTQVKETLKNLEGLESDLVALQKRIISNKK